jgi:hypothetical protein
MRKRHTPQRTCVACRSTGDKRVLLRIVRQPDGHVLYDPTGKASGRGAYVCASEACIAAARKQKRLDRSLKAEVPPEVFEALLALASPQPS